MTDSSSTSRVPYLPSRRLPTPPLYLQASVTVLLAGWADFLFYGRSLGVSIALFCWTLALFAALVVPHRIEVRQLCISVVVLLLALVPVFVDLTILNSAIAVAGTVGSVLVLHGKLAQGLQRSAGELVAFLLNLPLRLLRDAGMVLRIRQRHLRYAQDNIGLVVWVIPLACTVAFAGLFASANPLLAAWLSALDIAGLLNAIDGRRLVFWCAALVLLWPFIRIRLARLSAVRGRKAEAEASPVNRSEMFGEPAIFRALVMFNLLFGFQNTLDATFLLAGTELPEGLTYAEYAHRGAYTLIATAILSAVFVLVATRPGSRSENSSRVRVAVLAWTLQNVLLVAFSIQRLALYVEVYALTYWRVAAFFWMAPVLTGLLLIFAKFLLDRGNTWLVATNLVAMATVLYVAGLVNVSALVGNFNVAAAGPGKYALDVAYLISLGPNAIPAMDRAIMEHKRLGLSRDARSANSVDWLVRRRNDHARAQAYRAMDWRAWSLRQYNLQRYLDTTRPVALPSAHGYLTRCCLYQPHHTET